MTGPLQGDTYPSFLQFLGFEFFQELTKFVLEEVSLFHILNFNVVLVGGKDIDYDLFISEDITTALSHYLTSKSKTVPDSDPPLW